MEALDQPVMPEEVAVDPLTIIVGTGALVVGAGAAAWRGARQSVTVAAERDALAVKAARENAAHQAELESVRATASVEAREELARAKEALLNEGDAHRKRLADEESRLRARVSELERRAARAERREEDLGRREEKLSEREQGMDRRQEELTGLRLKALEKLEELSELSRDEARDKLLAQVEEGARGAIAKRLKHLEEAARDRAEATAKNIISMAIQRYAGEYICERTVSLVNLPTEELKGRIIGREGRNIRALEAATGVDFIIDDTPQVIVISAFNPIRREVARRALETLLEDGRIHPSRVESVVRKTEADFHKIIRRAGAEAADEVGVSGINPEILKLIGALKYRTSYGQNQWQHAIEVSFLCGMMASELGLDVKRAKRAGLLHDIGKVLDQTAEGSHALIGAEFARTHGEGQVIVNAIASHHEEVPQETIYACLAQAADAISGARPGARRQMMQSYTQRLSDLERISNSFPGVDRSYAVQAGREVRIIVSNGAVTDEEAVVLSHEIAQKIESEMSYPGQVKVTVIRETRVVNYAR